MRLLELHCKLLGISPGAALLFGFLSDVACGFSATGRFGTMLAISPWELDTCRGSFHIPGTLAEVQNPPGVVL